MFRTTEDPSSGSLVQCLAKNYKNDSIVSVDMDKVDVMAAYCDPLCVCVCVCVRVCVVHCVPSYTVNCTHPLRLKYPVMTPTMSMSTDTIESLL
jgi:hypothetical protein